MVWFGNWVLAGFLTDLTSIFKSEQFVRCLVLNVMLLLWGRSILIYFEGSHFIFPELKLLSCLPSRCRREAIRAVTLRRAEINVGKE